MIRLAWHPLARSELFEATEFYEKESSGLGGLFLDRVQVALDHLRRHPRVGRELLPEVRRFLVLRFPYSLVYRIEAVRRQERIFILAVAHQKRRPRYWARRL